MEYKPGGLSIMAKSILTKNGRST